MTDLRQAAQQALEALDGVLDSYGEPLNLLSISGGAYEAMQCRDAITALRAALAEPEDWELRRLREELERCKQTCAATSEAWREEAALAEQTVASDCADSHQPLNEPCNKSCAPGYCYCECPATNSEPLPVFTTLRQREWPALWAGCPNCASLQDQNTELDRKLGELERKHAALIDAVLRSNELEAARE